MNTLATALLPTLILASCPAEALQPFATDDTGTQGVAGNQLELAMERARATTTGNGADLRILALTFTRGLSDTIDASAGVSYQWLAKSLTGDSRASFDSVSLGGKWRFLQNDASGVSFALKPEIRLPLSSQAAGGPPTSGTIAVLATREGAAWAVHLNLGVGAERHADPAGTANSTSLAASLAQVWNLGPEWKIGFEFGAAIVRAGGASLHTQILGIGTVYSPSRDCDLAFRLSGSGDNAALATTARSVNAGLTWRFQ